ncbi:hypothetical protein E2C01_023224 [Portunus trituberculatus]|uniref:Secreted protein n=1 Tax=Portunus trituberculatus TaxID=210409 RepID=A0A5B7E7E8_PORTR|nr:hypothetical protein [Portunus trituberculatus]
MILYEALCMTLCSALLCSLPRCSTRPSFQHSPAAHRPFRTFHSLLYGVTVSINNKRKYLAGHSLARRTLIDLSWLRLPWAGVALEAPEANHQVTSPSSSRHARATTCPPRLARDLLPFRLMTPFKEPHDTYALIFP